MFRRLYPPDIFPALWKDIENLVKQGLLVAPREVLHELEWLEKNPQKKKTIPGGTDPEGNDLLLKWAKMNKGMFIEPDLTQNNYIDSASIITNEILPGYGKRLVDIDKETPEADPFVIALAKLKRWIVINSEGSVKPGPSNPPKIPDVCRHHKVESIGILEFFRRVGLKY